MRIRRHVHLAHWNRWAEWRTRLQLVWVALTADEIWIEGDEDL